MTAHHTRAGGAVDRLPGARADLRHVVSLVADAAIIACDAIDDRRSSDDDIDAAVDGVRRAYATAMAAYAAERASDTGTTP